jgi:signal transduction histidine kinase
LLKSRQRISEIVGSIAHRFLSQHELQSTLDQIVWAAHTDLEADVVTLYERDPLTGKVSGSACAGDLLHPEIFNATVAESDNLVKRLLVATDNCYFHEDVQSLSEDSIFRQSDRHARSGAPTFAEREKIESRAIIRLQTGSDRVGLMFLNFRSHRSFDDQEREPFFTFAHLAALAIQKAQFHQQQIQFERENLARQLHDQLMANADAVCRLVSLALRDMSTSDPHHSTLMLTKEAIKELKRDVKYLNETLKDTSLENLPDEVAKMTGRVKKAYGVAFEIRWTGNGYRVPTAVAVQLKLILNEAIINAIKHGDATKIKLSFEVFDSYLDISIEDNGSGFDTTRVRPSGLANMQERAERMSGYCRVESHLGTGTHVSIHVPYTTLKGDNHGATREL